VFKCITWTSITPSIFTLVLCNLDYLQPVGDKYYKKGNTTSSPDLFINTDMLYYYHYHCDSI
jgi:hypothetical protein